MEMAWLVLIHIVSNAWLSFDVSKQWCSKKSSPCISFRIQSTRTEVIHALQHCCCTKSFTDKWCAVFVCMIKCYSLKKWSTVNSVYRLKRFTLILCKYVCITLNCDAPLKNEHHILRQFTVKTCPQYYFWLPPPFRQQCEEKSEENACITETYSYLPTPNEFVMPI